VIRGDVMTRSMLSNTLVTAVLMPVSSSVPVSSAMSRISAQISGPHTSMPFTAWVTYRVSSSSRTASASARPACRPTPVAASGISLPML
jgi:hypothetical protein